MPPFEAQSGNLLGDEPDEKHHHRQHDQEDRGIGDVRLSGDGPHGVAGADENDARLIGRKTRNGLKSVMMRRMISRKRTPSRASLIFEAPGALPRVDRLERHVVARLDERQCRRRRRGESVGQEVDELAEVFAARGAES